MKIGIIGAGHIGGTLAELFTRVGHTVLISNSRGPQTLEDLVEKLGDNAAAGTIDEARDFGDVVVVSIPLKAISDLPANGWEGRVTIDTNNYYPDRDGHIADLDSEKTTSSELLVKQLPGARIVKAFNTIWFEHLKTEGDVALPLEQRRAIFVAGDDSEAKEIVAKLIDEIGFATVDTGFLAAGGRTQQPGTAVYNKQLNAEEAAKALSASA